MKTNTDTPLQLGVCLWLYIRIILQTQRFDTANYELVPPAYVGVS